MPNSKRVHYFETSGFSMWPFLRRGDRIVVEEFDPARARPGDIVLYKEQGCQICHRLVEKKTVSGTRVFFVRGDYLPSWKTVAVDQARLAGRVRAIVRGKRVISLQGFWSAAGGRLIVIFFPLAVLFFVGVRKLVKK
ncbi:MAG: hypothetical protein WCY10_05625 [Candidatus Omnitrophota bacterium]